MVPHEVKLGIRGPIDSDPELEYEETLHKGRAMFEALGWARDVVHTE